MYAHNQTVAILSSYLQFWLYFKSALTLRTVLRICQLKMSLRVMIFQCNTAKTNEFTIPKSLYFWE